MLNAANEVAVAAFLEHKITFYDIPRLIESSMNYFNCADYNSIDEVMEIDVSARNYVGGLI